MTHLKSHAIYLALRERILSNDIGPGTRLVMRDVANQYEASDIPVREALRMLERDGLVETAPYRGARVTTLTAKEVEETYFIRSHLESIATGLAAERITDAELAQLDRLMIEMRSAVDAEDGPTFSDLNLEFHRTIVASCGNDMLRELTIDIWQRHSGFQRVFRMVPGRLATSQREHEGIMAALRDHDADRASRLALLHKLSVRDSVSTLVDAGRRAQVGSGGRVGGRCSTCPEGLGMARRLVHGGPLRSGAIRLLVLLRLLLAVLGLGRLLRKAALGLRVRLAGLRILLVGLVGPVLREFAHMARLPGTDAKSPVGRGRSARRAVGVVSAVS